MAALLLALPVALAAQDTSRTQRVEFARGASSVVLGGTIRDYSINVYIVPARAGQTMTAALRSSLASNRFTVMSPGGSIVLFDGTLARGAFHGKLPADGDYRITVFLLRDAPPRNEVGSYSLIIDVK
jgi:hypothetical protein